MATSHVPLAQYRPDQPLLYMRGLQLQSRTPQTWPTQYGPPPQPVPMWSNPAAPARMWVDGLGPSPPDHWPEEEHVNYVRSGGRGSYGYNGGGRYQADQ